MSSRLSASRPTAKSTSLRVDTLGGAQQIWGAIMRDTFKATYFAIVLLLGLFVPAMAQTKEDADAALSREDFATAARLYRSLAEHGKASAQHQLAKMYENGQGVPTSQAEAAKWYRLAAERGHAGAQLYLGGMYLAGDGVPRDYVQAYVWFSLSAAAGQ